MMNSVKSNIEIANQAKLNPITEIAEGKLGIQPENLEPYGRYKAKIPLHYINSLQDRPNGKLILVTAMTPTTAGEGKTTTLIGLTDALNGMGQKTIAAVREPSLGPCFGMKGGACGGGYAQIVPMADINLHFTGDFHAITSASNLLASMIDNHAYWGHEPQLDVRRITWRRAMDMNDRSLRYIVTGLGGLPHGVVRDAKFDITAASEVMAILCLASNLKDLQRRLGNIKIGRNMTKEFVFARDLKADGAMAALLKDAINPNLVQTLEHNPAFVHGGPFANIAHGCNSVAATTLALKLADYVVTEAGFGADLGAEKFFNIKCRKAGLTPACTVVVGTIRALKLHGGADPKLLGKEDLGALRQGLPNLFRHVENVRKFGVPAIVAINKFASDTNAEIEAVLNACRDDGLTVELADQWANGSEGAMALANTVLGVIEREKTDFQLLYPDDLPLAQKVRIIAQEMYGADDVNIPKKVLDRFSELEQSGYGHFPVCMAKTQYSFSTDPKKKGVPKGFNIPVRELRFSFGAEFIVVLTGDIMTMPGLPRVPAANAICLDEHGEISGLF
jgi:formate--tetrahydrofolate ligase